MLAGYNYAGGRDCVKRATLAHLRCQHGSAVPSIAISGTTTERFHKSYEHFPRSNSLETVISRAVNYWLNASLTVLWISKITSHFDAE